MIGNRKFPRVRLTAKCVLSYQNVDYEGQLENISISGALVRLEQCICAPHSGENKLTIYIEGDTSPLQLNIEVVCTSFTLTGIKFVSCDAESATRLGQLVEKSASEADMQETEREKIQLYLSNYVRGASMG